MPPFQLIPILSATSMRHRSLPVLFGHREGAGRSGGRTEPPGLCPPRAPHCAGRCSHITPLGQAPRGRSLPPTGAVPGSAPLAHWQDFAAVCSEPRFGGAMRAALLLGRVSPGRRGGGDAPHSPPQKKKCDVEGAACAGSIPSCHGDAGCILGQSIAGSCVGAPTFLPAAVTAGCVWGQGGGTTLLLGTAQSWTSPQHQPAASGCGVEPPDLIQRGAFGAGGSPGLPRRGHWQRDRSGMVAGGQLLVTHIP